MVMVEVGKLCKLVNEFVGGDSYLIFRRTSLIYISIFIVLCFAQPSFSQVEKDIPKDLVPPPLNIVSKEEIKQLKAEKKMKKRTKLALKMMEFRLMKSEEFVEKNEYAKSLDQIGKFQGLLINTLKYLKRNKRSRGVHKNFKRFEINLREFMPRLEIIRREMPIKYGYHVRKMLVFVRDARTKALSPLFDDTVLSEGSRL